MKHLTLYLSIFVFQLTCSSLYSTNWIVANSGLSFTPATITITVGDSVQFSLSLSHDAVEVSQTTWNANGNTPNGGFSIPFGGGQLLPAQLSVVGTYFYVCTPHAGAGMKARIIVQACVPPVMPASISGSATICNGVSSQFTTAVVSGVTSYNWTIPGGWSGSSTTNSISVTPNSSSGVLSVSASNNCGTSSAQTLSVTVNSIPGSPGVISGNNTICSGSSSTYSIGLVSGATSYTWQTPVGWSGSSTSNSINTTAGSSGGIISVASVNGCGTSAAQTLSVSVITIPTVPGSISGNTSVCISVFNNYSIAAVSGASSYSWTLPPGWSGNSTSTSIGGTPGSSGVLSVASVNTCGTSSAQTIQVTVDTSIPAAPGTISGNGTICVNSNNTYSVATVSGATFYNWTMPSGWTGSSTSNSISATASAVSGNVSITAGNACGNSAASILPITVTTTNSAPSMPTAIAGNDTVCVGSTESYSITNVSGATSYTWTLPVGWSGSSTSTNINATVVNQNGIVSVRAINSCGSSAAQTLQVQVSDLPLTPTTISGNSTICSGQIETYTVPVVSGVSSYVWTLPIGWTGSSSTNTIQATAGGSGVISVSAVSFCGASSAQTLSVVVNSVPPPPAAISGSVSICSGSLAVYSVSPVSGALTYTWSFPAGWSGSGTGNSVNVTTGSSGTISVSANNSCGNSSVQTLAVTGISSPAQPGMISGSAMICEGEQSVFSVSPVSGASNYTWQTPAGWTGSSNNNIYTGSGGVSGNLTVTATNACGTSSPAFLNITVHSVDTTVQINSGTLTAAAGGTYQWVTCPAFSSIAGANSQSYSPATSGMYAVVITLSGCTDTSSCIPIIIAASDTEIGVEENLKIFPNPSNGIFQLELADAEWIYSSINIYNSDGRLVLQTHYVNSLDLGSFPSGIYSIQVSSGDKIFQRLVVIQK